MLRRSTQIRALRLLATSTQSMQLRSATRAMSTPTSTNTQENVVEHNESMKQFQYLGGHLDYEIYEEKLKNSSLPVMDMIHTFVPPSGRGKGIAKILCDEAFEFARVNNLAIRPSCSYVSQNYIVKYNPDNVKIV